MTGLKILSCGCYPCLRGDNGIMTCSHGTETEMDPQPDLVWRSARCRDCGAVESSAYYHTLAFFAHKTGSALDEFYCGCWGWD